MALPVPQIGLLIRYSYLWRNEARQGRDEAVKDRPCVIVHRRPTATGALEVFVSPVTHSRPVSQESAVPIPAATRSRLGLDHDDSWVIASECNRFLWPGPDIRPLPSGTFAYGFLPHRMTEHIIEQMKARTTITNRDKDQKG